jgi:hypothetical protein
VRRRTTAAALILAGLVWLPAGTTTDTGASLAECVRPSGVQRIVFSAREYPNVRRHFRGALRRGWPRRLVLNRRGADARRERALRDVPTREGSIATSTPQPLAAAAGPGWSVVATRAAGRPTCAMCPAPRTDRTARRSEADSSVSATGPAFAMCSADSASYPLPTTRNSGRLCSASRIAACHLPGRSSKCPRRVRPRGTLDVWCSPISQSGG